MDTLTAFGLFAVTAMLICYALEDRSRWFVLAFAAACALGSAYGFLQGAWPFGVVEAIWSSRTVAGAEDSPVEVAAGSIGAASASVLIRSTWFSERRRSRSNLLSPLWGVGSSR